MPELVRVALLLAALGGPAPADCQAPWATGPHAPGAPRLAAWEPAIAGADWICNAGRAAGSAGPGAATDRVADAGRIADAWLGADKFQHFWVSFAATAYSFGAVRATGVDAGVALYIAVPVAAVAGFGKEVHDRRRGGFFSMRDLVADGLGIAAAWVILREVR
jgi:hypothetical protein